MPKTTGSEFFTSILYTYPKPIRILITSYADFKATVDAINKGRIFQRLEKPFYEFDIRLALESAFRLYYEKHSLSEGKKIFISHSSKDLAVVTSFVDNVLKLGLGIASQDIFCSSIDEMGIRSGRNFREVIKEELTNSRMVIQIITENYKQSEVCMNEMGAAWVLNTNVIPFIIEPVTYTNVGFIHASSELLNLGDKNKILKFADGMREDFDIDINVMRLSRHIDAFVNFLT